jgi:hypothetical protein
VNDPLGVNGTAAFGISGNNIVGVYLDSSGNNNGFLYNGSTWTTLDDPLGVNGTQVLGIDGNNIVGYYIDSSGNMNGFLYNGSTYTTVDDPLGVYTLPFGISGNNIVGYYYDSSSGVSWSGFEASVPEPSTLALSALGGLSLLLFRRRK